jgi:hypothetical protein
MQRRDSIYRSRRRGIRGLQTKVSTTKRNRYRFSIRPVVLIEEGDAVTEFKRPGSERILAEQPHKERMAPADPGADA